MSALKRSKTRQKLLENTINHYNLSNRAINGKNDCTYISQDNKRCAIGREISLQKCKYFEENGFGGVTDSPEVFESLPKRLKSMGIDFLTEIQNLHDQEYHWTNKGLSELGEEKVSEICIDYELKNPLK